MKYHFAQHSRIKQICFYFYFLFLLRTEAPRTVSFLSASEESASEESDRESSDQELELDIDDEILSEVTVSEDVVGKLECSNLYHIFRKIVGRTGLDGQGEH